MDFDKACKLLKLKITTAITNDELDACYNNSSKSLQVFEAYEYIKNNINKIIIAIVGVITNVVPKNRNEKKITIQCDFPDNRKLVISLSGFYPLRETDVISGYINTTSNTFISQPAIQISTTEASIINMLSSFRIKGVRPSVWNEIYGLMSNMCNNNKEEIVNTFTKWAYEATHGSIKSIIPSKIYAKLKDNDPPINGKDDATWKRFLSLWNASYSMRSLYLLGLSKSEILNFGEAPDVLYTRCLTNPFAVPCVSLEKCEVIMLRLNHEVTETHRFCGKILRNIYDRTVKGVHNFLLLSHCRHLFPTIENYKDELTKDYFIIFDNGKVYYEMIHKKEVAVAAFLVRLLLQSDPPEITPVYEMDTLTDEQKEAIVLALNSNLSFYTGGAGSGKSTIIREIVRNNDVNDVCYVLSSFTGKAVARIKELTRKPAFTLDYLMTKEILATIDHLIIDEISMTSLDLMYRLCSKLSLRSTLPKITMVGDQNQLPPIGYGYPFREIIKIPRIGRVILTKNHRLDTDNPDEHGVMIACQEILNNGPSCQLNSCATFTITYGDEATVATLFQQFKDSDYTEDDVVCISPYKDAVKSLNVVASEIFHPTNESSHTDPSVTIRRQCWKEGDKIIVNVNLYNIDVMNGETGVIIKIDEMFVYILFTNGVRAQFRYVATQAEIDAFDEDKEEFNNNNDEEKTTDTEMNTAMISQAYALTVHKSQGSEFDYGILYYPYVQVKGMFLTKELVYTQISRCKIAGFLIIPPGTLHDLELCCNKSARDMRHDALAERVNQLLKDEDAKIKNTFWDGIDNDDDDDPPMYEEDDDDDSMQL